MVGPNQTLTYNVETDSKGERTRINEIYRKFRDGDYLLSPYTMWTIQLKKAEAWGRVEFDELKEYGYEVDLELVGEGTYVEDGDFKGPNGRDLDMDLYYEREY